ncbi:hypothetical protein B0H21DRAFT_400251 [Amylocystis lapponica]|nr:hypothetical protein B0H21DRAFT_400251 [Amylocystis lapponica]
MVHQAHILLCRHRQRHSRMMRRSSTLMNGDNDCCTGYAIHARRSLARVAPFNYSSGASDPTATILLPRTSRGQALTLAVCRGERASPGADRRGVPILVLAQYMTVTSLLMSRAMFSSDDRLQDTETVQTASCDDAGACAVTVPALDSARFLCWYGLDGPGRCLC